MYSKASALSHALGTALALNAIGEVYSYTGRNREAGSAHIQALEMFDSFRWNIFFQLRYRKRNKTNVQIIMPPR